MRQCRLFAFQVPLGSTADGRPNGAVLSGRAGRLARVTEQRRPRGDAFHGFRDTDPVGAFCSLPQARGPPAQGAARRPQNPLPSGFEHTERRKPLPKSQCPDAISCVTTVPIDPPTELPQPRVASRTSTSWRGGRTGTTTTIMKHASIIVMTRGVIARLTTCC